MNRLDIQERNRLLCQRYPFLTPRDRWTDEVCYDDPYDPGLDDWTLLDDMPKGWRIAFGEQMCEEIRNALLESGGEDALNAYRIEQIKEKYGALRWYGNSTDKKVLDIIDHYEDLSEETCIRCGKHATQVSCKWISPFCDDCAELLSNQCGTEFTPLLL